jgi:MFS family permease
MASTRVTSRSTLWRNRDFVKLWAGQTVSLAGSQVTTLALPLTAVLLLRATPVQTGLLYAAQFAPFLVLTLFAGVLVDRMRRRPILIAADLGRALLLGLIPLFAWLGWLRFTHLVVVAFLAGCLTVFFHLAYQAFLPTLLGRDHLTEGNGHLAASESAAEIGGPGLGGVLVQLLSAPFALGADALSFLVSALSLASLRTCESLPQRRADRRLLADIRAGFRVTFGSPYLRALLGEAAIFNFFENGMLTVFVVYAIRTLHLSPLVYGAIFVVGSAGGLLGAVLTGAAARRFGVGRTMVAAAALSSSAVVPVPLAGGPPALTVAVLAFSFFLRGAGVTGTNVHAVSLRQALTPDHLLGRMNASYRTISYGAIPLGALTGGALGQWLGLRPALFVLASGIFFTWLWLRFSPIATLRELPSQQTIPAILAAAASEPEPVPEPAEPLAV